MAKDVRLPKLDLEDYRVTEPMLTSKIWKILWAVDPARIRVIPDETLRNLLQIGVNHAIKEANIEIEMRKNDIAAFEAMGKAIGKI
jgi:hypothetical protein